MTLVILAAGLGSRYGGLKQLDPMSDAGEFIIDFSVYDALRAGFTKVVFVIKPENEQLFRESIGERIAAHIPVEYAYQTLSTCLPEGTVLPEGRTKPLGTGHAVLCAEKAVAGDCFAVINADDFYGEETFRRLAGFLQNEGDGSEYAMVGFPLRLTLTENGSVSRGVCAVDRDGYLQKIDERLKIFRRPDGQVVYLEDGVETPLDENGAVSMNCWGFTARLFDELRTGFAEFLSALPFGEEEKPLKSEYYLPVRVDEIMRAGRCRVKVLPTESRWYGVTYPADKPGVKASIAALIEAGDYPNGLWKK